MKLLGATTSYYQLHSGFGASLARTSEPHGYSVGALAHQGDQENLKQSCPAGAAPQRGLKPFCSSEIAAKM